MFMQSVANRIAEMLITEASAIKKTARHAFQGMKYQLTNSNYRNNILTLDRSLDKLVLSYRLHNSKTKNGGRCHPYYGLLRLLRNGVEGVPLLNDERLSVTPVECRHDAVQVFVSDNSGKLFTAWARDPVKSWGPGLTIAFMSAFLDRVGDVEAVFYAREWICQSIAPELDLVELVSQEIVSSVDIKNDLLVTANSPYDLNTASAEQWVTRLQKSPWEEGARFGSPERIGLRVYDKGAKFNPAELRNYLALRKVPGLTTDGFTLWLDDTEMKLWRVEPQFGRRWLGERGIGTFEDLIAASPSLVQGALEKVSLKTARASGNRSSFDTHPVWMHLKIEAMEETILQKQEPLTAMVELTIAEDGDNFNPYVPVRRSPRATGYSGKSYDSVSDVAIDQAASHTDNSWLDDTGDDFGILEILHDDQLQTWRSQQELQPKSKSPLRRQARFKRIPLVSSDLFAVVDSEDFTRVLKFSPTWHCKQDAKGRIYAEATYKRPDGNWATIGMHRLILGAPDDMLVDHINHDVLDNRKRNLRIVSHSGNVHNSRGHVNSKSRYKGVSPKGKLWRADYGRIYLGCFETEEQAAEMYNRFAYALDKECAYLNVLPDAYVLDCPTTFRLTKCGVLSQPTYGLLWELPPTAFAYLQSLS